MRCFSPSLQLIPGTGKRTALGTEGTIPDALTLINARLIKLRVAAKVLVGRVDEGATVNETIATILGDVISTVLEAFVHRLRWLRLRRHRQGGRGRFLAPP